MHVLVATDGSRQSLVAARVFMSFADVTKVDEVSVVAVISPLATVPFANELGGEGPDDPTRLSFRQEAHSATGIVMAEFQGWGVAAVHRRILSGSPAPEIVKAAKESGADLIVVASGSGGLSDTILLGSTAQRVQHSAPCPVLVARPKV
ncbi:MAG TPA: universal stress protein [Mycobacteriales bacterium]|jgi:nucleotide-binding universal stress UspA family protein|nr:universal stress protein [Mycobacteriales bacterium]